MGRWLTLYRDITSAATDEDKRWIIDDFLARPTCPVRHDVSPSVISKRLGFSDPSSLTEAQRNAVTLARWILKERPNEVHVRPVCLRLSTGLHQMLREVRLPKLRLCAPVIRFGAQSKVAYPVNPKLRGR
jgi:hypothetical protein